MSLDFQGTLVSVVQITALILLTIGVYPYRIRTKNRNLIMHGFLGIVALALNLGTVIWVMFPSFGSGISTWSLTQLTVVLLHAVLGTISIVLGFVIIASWVIHPLGEMGCNKTWRLMIPTFAVWALALMIGLAIYFFNIV